MTRTISAALSCLEIERVVVATDDPQIEGLAVAASAGIVRLRPELATGTADSDAMVLHALDVLREREALEPELVAVLECAAPRLTVLDITGTIATLLREDAGSALAASPSQVRLWSRDETGGARGVNHDAGADPPRARAPEFAEAGSVYVFRTAGFRAARRRFFGRIALHVLTEGPALDASLLPDPLGGVVFDFDGVFTDNGVWTTQDGHESVRCDRSDGLGIGLLLRAGVPALVLSKERNPVVAARCAKLGIECRQGIDDKLPALRAWAREHGTDLDGLVYVGNDLNDVPCLEAVGLGVAVADAWPVALKAARLRLTRSGGAGAVRELCDLVLGALEARRPGR